MRISSLHDQVQCDLWTALNALHGSSIQLKFKNVCHAQPENRSTSKSPQRTKSVQHFALLSVRDKPGQRDWVVLILSFSELTKSFSLKPTQAWAGIVKYFLILNPITLAHFTPSRFPFLWSIFLLDLFPAGPFEFLFRFYNFDRQLNRSQNLSSNLLLFIIRSLC